MESHARYTLVGLVIVTLVVGCVVAVVWLSRSGENLQPFTIYFREHSLAGLDVDGSVTMRGIRVGKILGLEIPGNDMERVKVVVGVAPGTPVKTDSRALVTRNLLTGIAGIDIVGGTKDAELLREATPAMESPLIPEGVPRMERVVESLPDVIEELNSFVERASNFLSDENRKNVSELIANLESLTRKVASKEQRVDTLLSDTLALISRLQRVAENLDVAVRHAAFSLSGNMERLSSGVTRAAESLSETLERFDDPRALLAGPARSSLGPGEGEDAHDE